MPPRIGPISAPEFADRLAKLCLRPPAHASSSPRILDPFASLKRPVSHSNLVQQGHAAAAATTTTATITTTTMTTAMPPLRIGIAVSGGVDSMALVTLLARHYRSALNHTSAAVNPGTPEAGTVQLHGLIVDHKLRDESTAESRYVANEISKQGIIPHILTLDWSSTLQSKQELQLTSGHGQEQGQSIGQDLRPDKSHLETQARLERYRVIAEKCHALQIQELFVGHHRGDQVETVLFRLSRASGIDGLAGIQSLAPFGVLNVPEALDLQVARPLLDFDKSRLRATCEELGVKWVEDPSNRSLDYQRNVIRHYQQELDQKLTSLSGNDSAGNSPLSSAALIRFRQRMDQHRHAAWDQVRPWLKDVHFDTANGVCHLQLQKSLEDRENQSRQESIIATRSTRSAKMAGWLQSSELHVATRLVSFLVRWVSCKDHPPGLEDVQLMLQQMRLQLGGATLEKIMDTGKVAEPRECITAESKGSTVYKRTKKRRVSKQTGLDSANMVSGETTGGSKIMATQQPIQMFGVLLSPPRKTKGLPQHWTLSRQPLSQADQIATQIQLMLPIPDTLADHATPTPMPSTIPTAVTLSTPAPMDVLWDQRFFLRIQSKRTTADLTSNTTGARFDALVVRSLTLQDVQTLRKQRSDLDLDLSELDMLMTQLPTKARFTVPVVVGLDHFCDVCESSGRPETLVSIPTVNLHLFPQQFRIQSRFKSDRPLMELDTSRSDLSMTIINE
ncbi:tRNA(Ile)-lysidine synthase [Entomortierella parvispora]|uniref:tRNA(Ile)-lysidine synthetase n=1 Tax=Entomortierella parvispora TaxID=205924 RepID=A0A9P3HJJ3_9FUNG|nr:tRNA(Ile)-lysidine synthase [Entomortierella parvispora]